MPGFNNGVMHATNMRFDGIAYPGAFTTDGQLAIGSSVFPFIRIGTLTSTGGTVTITPGPGTLNLEAGATTPTTFTGDSGTATPALNNLNVEGGTSVGGTDTNINTIGSGSTLQVCLNNSIVLPITNSTGTSGVLYLSRGGIARRFLHAYSSAVAPSELYVGINAGNFTNSGRQNTGIGSAALGTVTSGSRNTAVGEGSGWRLTTSNDNTFLGTSSGNDEESGDNNTFIGGFSGEHQVSGSSNVALGYQALMGYGSVGASASYNVAIGHGTLGQVSSGVNNTAVGHTSGTITTGSYNLFLGSTAGANYVSSESSNIALLNYGVVGESNTIRIGTQGNGSGQQNIAYMAGIVGNTVANAEMVTVNSSTGQLGVQTLNNLPTWTVINADQTAAVGHGYFCNKAGLLSLALPATSAVGDVIEVANINTALGVTITQAANQQIFFGSGNSTLGAAGSYSSSAVGDTLKLVCRTANLEWQVVSSVGNWTPA